MDCFYSYLRKLFSFLKRDFLWYCTWIRYLINFSILSQSAPIFQVFLYIIYPLFSPYHVPKMGFFLAGFLLWQFSFNILNIWKNLLFQLKKWLVNNKRYCCWNIAWLDIYLAILFLCSSCYLQLLSNQNQCLFISISYSKFMINKEKNISLRWFVCVCVLYNAMFWNISFPGWCFPAFYGLYQKNFIVTNYGGELW